MNMQEKILYHQIHPAKLLTDWVSTIPALYLLWNHEIYRGVLLAFLPSIIASVLVIRFANLESYAASKFGQYVEKYMTGGMQALRLAGFVMMMFGAWYHESAWYLIPTGLILILFAWLRGKIVHSSRKAST
jgi:hypothetical protein